MTLGVVACPPDIYNLTVASYDSWKYFDVYRITAVDGDRMEHPMSDFICPLCMQPNQCLAGTSQVELCWCMQQQFPPAILAKASSQSSCICQSCLQQAQQQAKTTMAQVKQSVQFLRQFKAMPPQTTNS